VRKILITLFFIIIISIFLILDFAIANGKEPTKCDQSRNSFSSDYVILQETEPNNYTSLANLIDSNYSGQYQYCMQGTMTESRDDIDYYKIVVSQAGNICLTSIWAPGGIVYNKGWECDLMVGLYDSSFKFLNSSTLNGSGTAKYRYLDEYVPPGTYYIVVYVQTNFDYIFVDQPYAVYVSFEIPVSAINLNMNSTTISTGQSETLVASILPANATDRSVNWSSSDQTVATVDSNGKVTAIKAGTTTITATTTDGSKAALCSVSVEDPIIYVQSISLNKNSTSLIKGDSESLIAAITPANATNLSVHWASSNPSIATVDSNGLIQAAGPGTAEICVTTSDGNKSASCSVIVITRLMSLVLDMIDTNLGDYVTISTYGNTICATLRNGKETTNIQNVFASAPFLQALLNIDRLYSLQRINIGESSYTRTDILLDFSNQASNIQRDVVSLADNPDIKNYNELRFENLSGKSITLRFADEDVIIRLNGQNACFIATAAYGSYLDPHVDVLRQFRDNVLLHSSAGTWLVDEYYRHSPPIAAFIAEHDSLRLYTRLFLTPIVFAVVYPLQSFIIALVVLIACIIAFRLRLNIHQPSK